MKTEILEIILWILIGMFIGALFTMILLSHNQCTIQIIDIPAKTINGVVMP